MAGYSVVGFVLWLHGRSSFGNTYGNALRSAALPDLCRRCLRPTCLPHSGLFSVVSKTVLIGVFLALGLAACGPGSVRQPSDFGAAQSTRDGTVFFSSMPFQTG